MCFVNRAGDLLVPCLAPPLPSRHRTRLFLVEYLLSLQGLPSCFIHPPAYSFKQYLISTYYVPRTVFNAWDTVEGKYDAPVFMRFGKSKKNI